MDLFVLDKKSRRKSYNINFVLKKTKLVLNFLKVREFNVVLGPIVKDFKTNLVFFEDKISL